MAPSVLIFRWLPRVTKLLVDTNTGFFQTDCCSLPADQTKSFPRARDNYIPKGEEADLVRELDANSSPASVSKPDVTEEKNKSFCYHFNIDDAVWQTSTGFGNEETPF